MTDPILQQRISARARLGIPQWRASRLISTNIEVAERRAKFKVTFTQFLLLATLYGKAAEGIDYTVPGNNSSKQLDMYDYYCEYCWKNGYNLQQAAISTLAKFGGMPDILHEALKKGRIHLDPARPQ